MNLLFDSFWRAAVYCLRPRVIALSFMPLVLMVALTLGLGAFFWEAAVDGVRNGLDSISLISNLTLWLQNMGAGRLRLLLAPLIVVFAVTPVIVLLSLLLVSLLMTPALTTLVADRRFPALERKRGGTVLSSLFWSLGSTLMALIFLLLSMPLWLLPPLVLILPPLIWGWLTYRVMAFDALSEHASAQERRALLKAHRVSLLGMGVVCGFFGAAPSLIWASGAMFAAAFVILVPVAIWIYMLVFAFSSLWFAHYGLAALQALRTADTLAAAAAASATSALAPASVPAAAQAAGGDVIDVVAVTLNDEANRPLKLVA